MVDKYMWQREGLLDWQWPCGRVLMCVWLCMHARVYVFALGSECGLIPENLSL